MTTPPNFPRLSHPAVEAVLNSVEPNPDALLMAHAVVSRATMLHVLRGPGAARMTANGAASLSPLQAGLLALSVDMGQAAVQAATERPNNIGAYSRGRELLRDWCGTVFGLDAWRSFPDLHEPAAMPAGS